MNAAHKLTGGAETGNRFSVDFDDLCMLHYRRLATLTGQTKMKGPIVVCERVSSFDQNLARRLQQIKLEDTDKIVDDKASGANTNWPTFQQMMKYVRWGSIVVRSMDHLARNLANTTKSSRLTSSAFAPKRINPSGCVKK